MLDEAQRTGGTMEDNEEEDFDDHFPGNAGIDAFDDDIPMEEPEVDVAENDPSTTCVRWPIASSCRAQRLKMTISYGGRPLYG